MLMSLRFIHDLYCVVRFMLQIDAQVNILAVVTLKTLKSI
jgi:hypothetical protein